MFFTIFIMLMFYSYSGLCEHWQTKSLPVLLLLCLFSHYYSSTKVVLVAYLLLNTDVGIQTRGRTAKELLWAPPLMKKPWFSKWVRRSSRPSYRSLPVRDRCFSTRSAVSSDTATAMATYMAVTSCPGGW